MSCDCEKLFGNINDVYLANDQMWNKVIQKVLKNKRCSNRTKFEPSEVFSTFIEVSFFL